MSFYPSLIYSDFLDKSFDNWSSFKDETKIFALSNSKLLYSVLSSIKLFLSTPFTSGNNSSVGGR